MKKFGTPIGAGPGNDNENVGFFADGTPLPDGSVLAAFLWLRCLVERCRLRFACPPREDGGSA